MLTWPDDEDIDDLASQFFILIKMQVISEIAIISLTKLYIFDGFIPLAV